MVANTGNERNTHHRQLSASDAVKLCCCECGPMHVCVTQALASSDVAVVTLYLNAVAVLSIPRSGRTALPRSVNVVLLGVSGNRVS